MSKYTFPALFKQEKNGYSVVFPDINGCATSGKDLPEAVEMAEDALCLLLYDMEECGEPIPAPSGIKEITAGKDEICSLVFCDTIEYRKLYDNRAVKKTLTIPSWLNTIAEREGVNFSTVLQTALKQRLGLD